MSQPDLFDRPVADPSKAAPERPGIPLGDAHESGAASGGSVGSPLEEWFEAFHRFNPHVYVRLVALARQAKARGRERLGIGMLFEVLRWEHFLETTDSEFKLNNSLRSRYARLIMAQEPDLAGIFETRELKS